MDKEEIKRTVKMAEVVSRYGFNPNRAGFICCPFHKEKTPSCKIYDDSYYCFGCGEHGDIFDFVMKYEGIPFHAAYVSLGGTHINKKGRSRNQIRREIRDIKTKRSNHTQELSELEQVKKNILICETALKTFLPGSEEWCMCRFDLEKEKSKYDELSRKQGGEHNS